MDLKLLLLFIPTFAAISITPGMCMTLAMSLGISHGVRRTLWMMMGELLGVAIVAIAAVAGVAALMLNYPAVFEIFCWLGGGYLIYLGLKQWRSKANLAVASSDIDTVFHSRATLATQGFVTAIANPKGWAFMIAFLPPFISDRYPVSTQMIALLTVIVVIEFCSMLLYAAGGGQLSRWLVRGDKLDWINKASGALMIVIGLWLAVSH